MLFFSFLFFLSLSPWMSIIDLITSLRLKHKESIKWISRFIQYLKTPKLSTFRGPGVLGSEMNPPGWETKSCFFILSWVEQSEIRVTAGCWDVRLERNKREDEMCRALKGRGVWAGCFGEEVEVGGLRWVCLCLCGWGGGGGGWRLWTV